MARRVGFGDDGGDGGEPDHGDRHSDMLDARRNSPSAGADGEPRNRLIPAIFLTIWLVLWGFGVFFVAAALVGPAGAESGVASFAMIVWLVVAVIGWLLGLRALRRILRGEPVFKRKPGAGRRGGSPRFRGPSDPSDPDVG